MKHTLPSHRAARPAPTSHEAPFGIDEVFFSTTDRKGIIRSCNQVFSRVSGYTREELVGSPHNIVRHPDMPRGVFQVFWDELSAQRSVAAYVKNLSRDGSYYWVIATSVPTARGYLSVRIKPSTHYFDVVRQLYPELLALEREVERGEPARRRQAIEASRARLVESLASAGFADYQAFMRTALLAEVKQRELLVPTQLRVESSAQAVAGFDAASLVGLLRVCADLRGFVGTLTGRLDEYAALNQSLMDKARFVVDLADDVRLFSLNALLAATRVGEGGASLGAVASLMQTRCDASEPVFGHLTTEVEAAVDLLGDMLFPVAESRLASEMLMSFLHELLDGSTTSRASADDVGALAECVVEAVDRIRTSLRALDAGMQALRGHVASLGRDLGVLRTLELNGRIEAARTSDAANVVTLFHTIAEQIAAARTEMTALDQLGAFSFQAELAGASAAEAHTARLRQHLAAIG